MKAPTIGRIVHFVVQSELRGNNGCERIAPAIITGVIPESYPVMVNLTVFYNGSLSQHHGSVPQHAESPESAPDYTWFWPPRE